MKVLFVNCCIRGEESRTYELCQDYLAKLTAGREGFREEWQFEEVNLDSDEVKALDSSLLKLRNQLAEEGRWDDEMFKFARQLMEADHVIIGAPYWDLAFPAKLKAYLEQCCVTGLTFIYDEHGVPAGQCKAQALTYITTSGGYIGDFNFGYDYVKGLCMLLGIGKTQFISAEGLDIWGNDVSGIMKDAKSKITEIVNMI